MKSQIYSLSIRILCNIVFSIKNTQMKVIHCSLQSLMKKGFRKMLQIKKLRMKNHSNMRLYYSKYFSDIYSQSN